MGWGRVSSALLDEPVGWVIRALRPSLRALAPGMAQRQAHVLRAATRRNRSGTQPRLRRATSGDRPSWRRRVNKPENDDPIDFDPIELATDAA